MDLVQGEGGGGGGNGGNLSTSKHFSYSILLEAAASILHVILELNRKYEFIRIFGNFQRLPHRIAIIGEYSCYKRIIYHLSSNKTDRMFQIQ